METQERVSLVSVIVPVYNEREALPGLVRRLSEVARELADRYRFEFILVDDGSTDGSSAVACDLAAEDTRFRLIELRRNYGQTAALQAGFDAARGEFVVSMDADLQHFPEDIPRLLARIEEGFDVVCGWRRDRKEGIVRRWPSLVANWLIRVLTGLSIHDVGTTFRAYRADVVRDFRLLGENHRFVPVFAARVGARIGEVEIENVQRATGQSSYGLSRTLNVLLDILFVVFYVRYLDRPMRLFGRFALLLFAVAVAVTGALSYEYLSAGTSVVREHSGWFLLGLFLYVSSLQLLLAGLISEVIVRLYFQSGPKTYNVRRQLDQRGRGKHQDAGP